MVPLRRLGLAAASAILAACSSAPANPGAGGHGGGVTITGAGGGLPDAGPDASSGDAGGAPDASPADAGPPPDTLPSNRDRLLAAYLDWLQATAPAPQSNGLSGDQITTTCDLWAKLDPSARAVFLTLTARLQGSRLGADDTSMLSHVTRVYRISGGQGATASDPGSCGGGEYNRVIMSMDPTLHAALSAANAHKGAVQGNGKYDISDIPASSRWRDSHDLGGPHAPFDQSDETEGGAPRGQVHFFTDPSSPAANAPLGRLDLTSLVDPGALEMDQDYDCVHNSNPLCSYVTYGPLCLPMTSALGADIYHQGYGDFDPAYQPAGCP